MENFQKAIFLTGCKAYQAIMQLPMPKNLALDPKEWIAKKQHILFCAAFECYHGKQEVRAAECVMAIEGVYKPNPQVIKYIGDFFYWGARKTENGQYYDKAIEYYKELPFTVIHDSKDHIVNLADCYQARGKNSEFIDTWGSYLELNSQPNLEYKDIDRLHKRYQELTSEAHK